MEIKRVQVVCRGSVGCLEVPSGSRINPWLGSRGRGEGFQTLEIFFTVKVKSLKSDFRYISSHFRHWKGHKSENPEIAPMHMEIET